MNFKSLTLSTCLLSLATFAGAGIAQAALVAPTTTYVISGTFSDGAQLAGTTTSGAQFNINLTVSGINGFFTYDSTNPNDSLGFYNPAQPGVWQGLDLSDASAPGAELSLAFVLPPGATSFSGYTGGALCDATTNNCGQIVTYYSQNLDPTLSSGFAAMAPEPGSIGLLGVGLSAFGLVIRRRFVKN
jgi:hypothetical protein